MFWLYDGDDLCLFIYLLKKFMCHHKSLNFVHTWKHIFTWEGVRLIWVWLNSPVYFIVSYKWNKVLEDQVTVWALHRELVDVSKMYLQCLSIGKLWTTRATLKSTFLWTQTSIFQGFLCFFCFQHRQPRGWDWVENCKKKTDYFVDAHLP